MRADESLPLGTNEVLLTMEGWSEARIRDGRGVFEIKPADVKKLEPITTRLRKKIPLGKLKYFVPIDFLADRKTLLGYSETACLAAEFDSGRLEPRVEWQSEARVHRCVLSTDKQTVFVGRTGMKPEQVIQDGETTTVYHQTGRLDAYEVASGKKRSTFAGREPSSVFEIAASADGRWLAFNERTKVMGDASKAFRLVLWDLHANREKELGRFSSSVSFSADSSLLFACDFHHASKSTSVHQWSIPSGESKMLATAKECSLYLPELSLDGRWMVIRRSPLDRTKPLELELWDRRAERVAWTTTQDAGSLSDAVFDPTSRYLALVDGATGVRFLELSTNRVIRSFELAKNATPWYPQFSPDGSKFSLVAFDHTGSTPYSNNAASPSQPIVWLVDVSRPTQPERAPLPAIRAMQSIWTPDGKSLVVRGWDRLWLLDAMNINGAASKP